MVAVGGRSESGSGSGGRGRSRPGQMKWKLNGYTRKHAREGEWALGEERGRKSPFFFLLFLDWTEEKIKEAENFLRAAASVGRPSPCPVRPAQPGLAQPCPACLDRKNQGGSQGEQNEKKKELAK